MRHSAVRAKVAWVPYLLLSACALASGGCLAVAVGAVATTAAVGYTYYRGGVGQDFLTNFSTTWAATQWALADLGMPILEQTHAENSGSMQSRTGDGSKVSITLETRSAKIPAEGPITEVHVRIGYLFGDRKVSEALLDQIQTRLGAPGQAVALPPAVPGTVHQTAPPPLATAEPPAWGASAKK
jgi:hypothetical protein